MGFFKQRQAQIQRPIDETEDEQAFLNKMWSEIPTVEKSEPVNINSENAEQVAAELGMDAPKSVKPFQKAESSDLEKRLENALESLPTPAAFRDAMIALRKLRKERNSQDDKELKLIYQLAIWQSFCVTPYSKIAKCPTFEILSEAFEAVKELEYDWKTFGYEKLDLSSSDIKAMVAAWGEPKTHKTLNQVYKPLYKEWELKVKESMDF